MRWINMSFVPWAWGINGCASVVGAVLAVIMAMSHGFRFVTLAALAIYGVGVVAMKGSAKAVPTENLQVYGESPPAIFPMKTSPL